MEAWFRGALANRVRAARHGAEPMGRGGRCLLRAGAEPGQVGH
jgi:hypothetical protein